MPITNFERAVAVAKGLILSAMEDEGSGRYFGCNWLDAAAWQKSTKTAVGANLLRNDPERLLAWSQGDAEGFDALKLGVASVLEFHQYNELPVSIQDWLVGFLKGEVERPKARAGNKKNEGADFLVWLLVKRLVGEGMTATRNPFPQPDAPLESACDAIAEAFRELGLTPAEYDGVRKIWLRIKKHEGLAVPPT